MVPEAGVHAAFGDLGVEMLKKEHKKRNGHTRPMRCSRPFRSLACLKLSRIVCFVKLAPFIDTLILTTSYHTIRPAPMFRCIYA